MGKIFSDENASKDTRQKGTLKHKNRKYLKPGSLAQHRSCKAMIAKPYSDLKKKRMTVLKDGKTDCALQSNLIVGSPSVRSPAKANSPIAENLDVNQSNILMKTPKTPVVCSDPSDSMLESLPMDILVKIVCHLHHDQLKPAFHVSQRLRKAVMRARQIHFNYTTPDRSQQELLRVRTPVPAQHWPFRSNGSLNSARVSSPCTPKAPRPGPRPPSRLKYTDMRQIAAVLFQESSFPSRYMVPSVLQRPCKPVASHRVLFYEEELCQAVAQNKLR
ncbi:unnamed protein product [Rhodiola kirilowii]